MVKRGSVGTAWLVAGLSQAIFAAGCAWIAGVSNDVVLVENIDDKDASDAEAAANPQPLDASAEN